MKKNSFTAGICLPFVIFFILSTVLRLWLFFEFINTFAATSTCFDYNSGDVLVWNWFINCIKQLSKCSKLMLFLNNVTTYTDKLMLSIFSLEHARNSNLKTSRFLLCWWTTFGAQKYYIIATRKLRNYGRQRTAEMKAKWNYKLYTLRSCKWDTLQTKMKHVFLKKIHLF